MTRELIGDGDGNARLPENAGAKPEGRDDATGNGTGRFGSDLSMVSIVNVYQQKT
jgi:hypothetical protein